MGIQRPLNEERVSEIRDYVRTVDACFPNSIIIAVSSEDTKVEPNTSSLFIRNRPDVATVIDGQHRLAGFSDDFDLNFQLLVTIFTDMEVQDQAYLFSTINTKQTRINPSLARDLLEFSTIETPEKVAHNIAKASNLDNDSPWYRQIKMLGVKDEISNGIITQHAFVTEIIRLLYPAKNYQNPVRSTLKESKNDRTRLRSLEISSSEYPFWDFYMESHDELIKKILDNYFQAVKEVFPEDYGSSIPSYYK